MNAVIKALDELNYRIPRPILQAVFIDRAKQWRSTPESLSSQIRAEVVRPRVLVDCNLMGGTEGLIPLWDLETYRPDDFTSVYRIPKERTQGRSIIAVLNITFNDPTGIAYYGLALGCQSTQMLATAQGMLDAAGTVPVTSTAQVQLIGENVVMVKDVTLLPSNVFLRCLLASDDDMSHIQMRSYRHFSKLVELAVKSFIYNKMKIDIDIGELYGGQNLGSFKEVVDSYADAEELYQTYLIEKWQKVNTMNDRESYTRLLRQVIGGQR